MLRLTADANIPLAADAFGDLGPVTLVPGRDITRDVLVETDILWVRSVTRVDAGLLSGTPVRWVGSATAGTDHVDQEALARLGIAFAAAPGSNAASVVDWVLAGLLATARDRGESLDGKTLGIVGVGAVGSRLAPRARALGLAVRMCDPPRQQAGAEGLVGLSDLLHESDIVTLHVPLTDSRTSRWPTRGLIDEAVAEQMPPTAWLVNAARGGVVTAEAALRLARSRPVLLDVWPGEPTPQPALVEAAALATPHIAGYAWDGKVRGTEMLAHALRQWLGREDTWAPEPGPAPVLQAPAPASAVAWLDALVRQGYDVRADDRRFRTALAEAPDPARAFADLRRSYPHRRELSAHRVRGPVPASLSLAVAQGVGLSPAP